MSGKNNKNQFAALSLGVANPEKIEQAKGNKENENVTTATTATTKPTTFAAAAAPKETAKAKKDGVTAPTPKPSTTTANAVAQPKVVKQVPQTMPLPKMVANSAGGFSYQVTDMNRLRRFLCLGSEKGTYYISEQKLTLENATSIHRLMQSEYAMQALAEIENFSVEGRCAKQDSLLFAYALCARFAPLEVRQKAYESLSRICRIPTHLFMFIGYCEAFGDTTGWGRLHRKSVINWYNGQDASKLAFAVTKYAQREGWSHRDVLRLCHAKPSDAAHDLVYKYVTKGWEHLQSVEYKPTEETEKVYNFLNAVETIKVMDADKEKDALQLIQDFRLAREHLPTSMLSSQPIWTALLKEMPLTAMIRNLNKMTSVGLFQVAANLQLVTNKLNDVEQLKKNRVHPFNVLVALKTYNSGHGLKGKLQWQANPKISKALEECYYKSFAAVQPTGLNYLLALDVSGSMSCGSVIGSDAITPREASAALSMVTARTEKNCRFMGFSSTFVDLKINASMSLEAVTKQISGLPFAGTDCALPMIWAAEQRLKFDVFMVFTDNETFFGKIHPCKALQDYRAKMKVNAKLIVMGMTSNKFTIADPDDAGMLDMCGFDSSGPEIVRAFSLGEI